MTPGSCCSSCCSNSLLVCAVLSPPSPESSTCQQLWPFRFSLGALSSNFAAITNLPRHTWSCYMTYSSASICVSVSRPQSVSPSTTGSSEVVLKCSPAIDPASACFSCLFRRREVVPRTAYVHAGKIFGPVGACCSEDRRLNSLGCSYRRRRSRLHAHFQSTDKAAYSSKK